MNFQIRYPAGIEDEYDFWEIEQKGWMDIVVVFMEREIELSVYDETRLNLDMRNETARLGYFATKNLLVIPAVNRAEIEAAVGKMAARNFSDLTD